MKKYHNFSTLFKEGIFLILPLGLTFWVINWVWSFLRNLIPNSLMKFFPEAWQALSYFNILFDLIFLLIVLLLIIFFGMIASTVLGKFVHMLTEKILTMPTMIRPIYQTFKKVSAVIFSNGEKDDFSKRLSQSIIVPYPNTQTKSIGFITANNANIFLGPEKGKEWLTVYLPSAPLVSAGFFLLCRKDDTDVCLLASAQAMTTIISVGTNTTETINLDTSKNSGIPRKKNLIRTWFLNGIVFVTPFIGTISILSWIFRSLYTIMRVISIHFPYFSTTIPVIYQDFLFNIFLMIVMFLGICMLGFLGESAIGFGFRKMLHKIFESIPMLSSVYKIINKITEIFSSDQTKENKFNQAVLIPYPTQKTYAIGFVTGENTAHIQKSNSHQVPVFIPTTPIPTTGWFVFTDQKNIIPLNMSIEKAFALVISAGILTDE
ncbi:MAG: DUF502 domain-containing protein [Brevinema sp.]